MPRSPNPNSPEEMRRAVQKTNQGFAAHRTAYDHDSYDTAYGWGDHAMVGYHTDVTAAAWLAANHETTYNHANYDTAYNWGDHGVAGYLKADGSVNLTGNLTVGAAVTIDGRDISADGAVLDGLVLTGGGKVQIDVAATPDYLGAAFNDGALRTGTGISYADGGDFVTLTTNDGEIDHGSLAGTGDDDHTDYHTDARAATWLAGAHETTYNHGQHDTAYGWGDHAGLYDAFGRMATHEGTYNHGQHDTAYGWGDHAGGGYLTSETSHADVLVDGDFASQGIMLRGAGAGSYSILADASANWNTAHGWGDHGSAGYLKADGSVNLAGNLTVEDGITIDGRDIRLDGGDIDWLVSNAGKAKVDSSATEDYLGAAFNDGALRTGTGISFADGGNFITLTTNDGEIAHDSLSEYDSNDHIDHTTVTFSAGSGLSGGGTLASDRSFALDISGLAADTIVGSDTIAFYDDTGDHLNKTSFTNFNAALDHGALGGLAGDDHTDYHTDGRADTWIAAGHETTYDHDTFGAGVPAIDDDVAFEIGTGVDYWFIYDSTETQFQFWTSDSDGAGTDAIVWSVTDGETDIVFPGNASFGAGGEPVEGLELGVDARVYSEFVGLLLQAEDNYGADETLDNKYEAIKFTADGNHVVRSIAVSLKRTGVITNGGSYLTFFLYTDDAGEPGTKIGTKTNLTMFGSLTTSYLTYFSGISDGITLSSGTDYWIVLRLNQTPAGGTIQFKRSSSGIARYAYGSDGLSWTVINQGTGWYEIYGEDDVAIYGASMNSIGILGESVNNIAIRGRSINSEGVKGSSINHYGVFGSSVHLHGLAGGSTNGSGIYGTSTNSNGVYGWSTNGWGVRGKSTNSYGVYGSGIYGGYFTGSSYGAWCNSGAGIGLRAQSSNDRAAHFYRNTASPSTGNEVVLVEQDHADDTSICMIIQQDGTGDILRLMNSFVTRFRVKADGDANIYGDLDITGALTVGSYSVGTLGCDNIIAASADAVVTIHATSDTGDAIYATSTGGICGHFFRQQTNPDGSPTVFVVNQNSSADPSVVMSVRGNGTGDILQIISSSNTFAVFQDNGEVHFTGRCYAGSVTQTYGFIGTCNGDDPEEAGVSGSCTLTGSGVYATSAGGNALYARGYEGRAAWFHRSVNTPDSGHELVRMEQGHASDPGAALVILQYGVGNALELYDSAALVAYFEETGILKTAGYKSSDGTAGVTGDVEAHLAGRMLNFKNGLYVGYTDP